jgi:hypothetical protein
MTTTECPNCGSPQVEQLPDGARRCAHCGSQIPAGGAGQPAAAQATGGAVFSSATIVVNGRAYTSPAEMPPEVRRAYERMMGVFADTDQDGVPDMFEGVVSAAGGQGDAPRLVQAVSHAPTVTVIGGARRARGGGGWIVALVLLIVTVTVLGVTASEWAPWLLAALG